jgi:DNA-binding HxlR family transcriptional regulator
MSPQVNVERATPIRNTRELIAAWDGTYAAYQRNEQQKPGNREGRAVSYDWDEIGFVISSQYRVAVLRRLSSTPSTPSQIAKEADCSIAHISRALHELREKELVELLVSEERRKGRVYGITETGQAIWEQIQTENLVE